MTYTMIPVEKYTDDPALQELIRLVGTGRLDPQTAQAAAWHLTDDMSWQELAAKKIERLGGLGGQPYFSTRQLLGAQNLIAAATARAKERAKEAPAPVSPGTQTSLSRAER